MLGPPSRSPLPATLPSQCLCLTYCPSDREAMMAALQRQGFAGTVFGIDLEGKSDAEIKKEYAAKYARAQAAHRADRVLNDGSVGERGRG